MNKIPPFLLSLFLFLFIGCSPTATTNSSSEKLETPDRIDSISPETQLSELIKKESEKGKQNDIIILDFRFGMTKKEVIKQMQKLVQTNKIVKRKVSNNRNAFVYELPLPKLGKVDVYFDFYYTNKKLSKVESFPRLPKGKTIENLLTGCAEVFETKYGVPDVIFPKKDVNNCANYFWIDGNRQIELYCSPDKVAFVYSNIKVEQKGVRPEKIDVEDLAI